MYGVYFYFLISAVCISTSTANGVLRDTAVEWSITKVWSYIYSTGGYRRRQVLRILVLAESTSILRLVPVPLRINLRTSYETPPNRTENLTNEEMSKREREKRGRDEEFRTMKAFCLPPPTQTRK